MKTITLLLITCLLAGCSTLRHYKKVATDTEVTQKKKETIAPWIAANFPTETRYVAGDTVVRYDTLTREDTLYWETVDTVSIPRAVIKYVTKTVTIRDTIYQTDEAKLFNERKLRRDTEVELVKTQAKLAGLQVENEQLLVDFNMSQKQKARLWWVIAGLVAFIGLVVWASIKKII